MLTAFVYTGKLSRLPTSIFAKNNKIILYYSNILKLIFEVSSLSLFLITMFH